MTDSLLSIQNQPHSTRALLLGLWTHLSGRRRFQLAILLAVMLLSGGAELGSLGAVLPFLAVLSDPEGLWQQPLIQLLANRVGFTQASQLLLPATLMFAVAAVLSAVIRLTNLWLNGRLAAAIGADLSCEAYRRTLYQPYGVHIRRNSASVITTVTNQINYTVAAINAFLQLVTSFLVAAGLLTGLLLIDATVAMAAAAIFGSAYVVLAIATRRELRRNGDKIAEAAKYHLKALQEGLGAIRDVLLDGSQPIYLKIYQQADRPQRRLIAKNAFLSTFPRYALEALGMVAIAFVGGMLVLQRGSGAALIPLLGVLALGAQRMLPALQQIYSSWATLKGHNSAIKSVLSMLEQRLPPIVDVDDQILFRECIKFEKIYFSYDSDKPVVLNGIDMEIRCGERIGLVGSTGSGKSTTVDLLMGLLAPTAGRLLIDGMDLYDPDHPERLTSWRASIAHVPQSIYLADSSIAENIAFGVPRQKIDLLRVKQAAMQAQIASFIESSSEGYDSFVGERGICLSGGQRQRIGIARALYKRSRVLVLDEATSALDTTTENSVMAAFEDLSSSITVIMIAHRLSTIAGCDRVIELSNGSINRIYRPSLLG